jgi:hypothetical protein
MRHTLFVILLTGGVWGQSLVETAGAAAGGTAGGVAGKKVSDGLNSVLGKVDKQTKTAADPAKNGNDTMFEVGPGVPKADQGSVPPPPPPRARKAKPAPVAEVPQVVVQPAPVAPPPPPPPPVTAEELKTVAVGTDRAEVLKLGAPASRITMFDDDGHLVEIYRYNAHDMTVGVVRLTDGTVSSVQMQ